jgi:hypothetical protein
MNVSLDAPPPRGRCDTGISAAVESGDNNNTEAR